MTTRILKFCLAAPLLTLPLAACGLLDDAAKVAARTGDKAEDVATAAARGAETATVQKAAHAPSEHDPLAIPKEVAGRAGEEHLEAMVADNDERPAAPSSGR